MALDVAGVRRHARQIALSEIGLEGQERLAAAEVALVGDDLSIETARLYLMAGGVGRLRAIGGAGWPADGAAWVERLTGASQIVRAGFEDDPMLRAAIRLGIPAVVMRAGRHQIDMLSFRAHGPCPHAPLDIPSRAPEAAPIEGALAVLAGTLAAAEAMWRIARPDAPPRARHLLVTMSQDEPMTQEIPWSPECFSCGGSGREAVLS